MRTRIKFCGITCVEDALAAAAAGADAVGFVFHTPAAAAVDAATAGAIATRLPPFVAAVALFVNHSCSEVENIIHTVRPQWLQFHGDEDATHCRQFGLPYIKACRVRAAGDIEAMTAAHPDAAGILLDAHVPGIPGGTGQTFDWSLLPPQPDKPLIVAGGLTATLVGQLVRQCRPWGVDTSTGVAEDNNRRRKNSDKMQAFVREVYEANIH